MSPGQGGDRPGEREGHIRWMGGQRQRQKVGMGPACLGDGEQPGWG